MAFFVTPAIADLDGDGTNEMIAGNGLYTLGAHDRARRPRPRVGPSSPAAGSSVRPASATGTATAGPSSPSLAATASSSCWHTSGRDRGPHRVDSRRRQQPQHRRLPRLTTPPNARSVARSHAMVTVYSRHTVNRSNSGRREHHRGRRRPGDPRLPRQPDRRGRGRADLGRPGPGRGPERRQHRRPRGGRAPRRRATATAARACPTPSPT